jgi:GlpG protein
MRLIGHLKTEDSAKTLGDYLLSINIRNQIESDADGWAIWVISEDQIEAGRQALENYLTNPADARFKNARQNAAAIDERDRQETADYRKRVRTADQIWVRAAPGPVTLSLILISVAVTVIYFMAPNSPMLTGIIYKLQISEVPGHELPEVRQGEIWRLITPIFIHLGIMHIIFNMMVLRDLGSLVESRRGSWVLLVLVLTLAIGSNLGQYFFAGPQFGGMSGVLYGLLGYVWLRGICDPASGLYLPPTSLMIMLVWFFLCLSGLIGNVANGAHAVGLVMGIIIGAAPIVKKIF